MCVCVCVCENLPNQSGKEKICTYIWLPCFLTSRILSPTVKMSVTR
jgi:hypothetical protein